MEAGFWRFAAAALFWPVVAAADCPPCGPEFCLDTPAYAAALTAKKAAATKAGFPARLVALYDALDHCKACVTRAPDGFSLFRAGTDSTISITAWDVENERIGAQDLAKGRLKACYVILARHQLEGCNRPKYGDRPDYDPALDLNKSLATVCQ
jgi:hypothetical protein